MELGIQKGKLSRTTTHCHLQTPRRKRHTLHLQQEKDYYFTTPAEEGRFSACPATSATSGNIATQPLGNHH